jgi:hypothetical protein
VSIKIIKTAISSIETKEQIKALQTVCVEHGPAPVRNSSSWSCMIQRMIQRMIQKLEMIAKGGQFACTSTIIMFECS